MNRRLGGWLAALLLLAAGLVVASTVHMVVRDAVPVPILDQWAQLVGARSVTAGWLFSQHNEHRLLFPRLVFLADRWLAAETGRLSLATSLLMQAALVLLLLHVARVAGRWRGPQVALAACVVVALLFWSVQYENFTWPFQVQFFGVLLAAAGCLTAAATLPATAWGVAATIGLGIVAAFTLASGVAVLFLATALAAWLRRPARIVAALAIASVATASVYLIGYQPPPEHTDPILALRQPWAVLYYAAALLGSPFANAVGLASGYVDPRLAELFGAAGTGLLLLLMALQVRRHAQAQACALLTLCLFVTATALLTASGRLHFGIASALASRYATPALVYWACLWLLGMRELPQRPGLGAAVAASVLALVGWTQPIFAHMSLQLAANRTIAIPALVAGVADQKVIAAIYPTPDAPLRFRLTEFDSRTGPFTLRWAPWIGTLLRDHVTLLDASRCAGRFTTVTPIADPQFPGWRVQGSLDRPGPKTRHVVALTDPGGRIVGYGISDADATTLQAAGPAGDPPRNQWVGAITGERPLQAKAYVLLDHERAACPLQDDPHGQSTLGVAMAGPPPGDAPAAGSVDAVSFRQQVTIDGWAMVQTGTGTPTIELDTNLPVQSAAIVAVSRPDAATAYKDARLADAGFRVVLLLHPGTALPERPHLCLWSEDAVYGRHRLIMNPATPAQRALCPG